MYARREKASVWAVGEPHPSKQGLKHVAAWSSAATRFRRRAPSIKTRIETADFFPSGGPNICVGEPHPSKQGLKHTAHHNSSLCRLSASPIHQNKD